MEILFTLDKLNRLFISLINESGSLSRNEVGKGEAERKEKEEKTFKKYFT